MTFFARGNYAPSNGIRHGSVPSALGNTNNGIRFLTVGQTFVLTPTMTNEFRYNYSSSTGFQSVSSTNFGGAVPVPQSVLFPPGYNPATDFQLGNFGLDTVNNVVWAVVNHCGVFGVTVVADPLALTAAVSRKTHGGAGAFDINLPH